MSKRPAPSTAGTPVHHERGSAMLLALGALGVLGLLAFVVSVLVVAEKRTSSSSYAHSRAFYSADAATEAGVHWIRGQLSPPSTVDTLNRVRASEGDSALSSDSRFAFEIQYVGKQFRPGWSTEYKDYIYRIQATGTSAEQSRAAMDINTTRLFREGY